MHTLIFSFFEESVDPPVVVVHSTERTKVTKHATSLESEVVRNKKEEDKDERQRRKTGRGAKSKRK
jgi:hypothetical protein